MSHNKSRWARAGLAVGVATLTVATVVPALSDLAAGSTLRFDGVDASSQKRVIESTDTVAGCGTAPVTKANKGIRVDGRGYDWKAPATMISGSDRYATGEYVWSDYAFDDDGTGAYQYPGEAEPLEPRAGGVAVANARGQRYGSNAADIVELRATADAGYLYFFVRLNFLNAVDSTAIGLAFDTDRDSRTGTATWPRGAQVTTEGSELFLTAFGSCAFVQTRGGERRLDEAGGATRVSTKDNIIEIALPRALLGGASKLRLAGGAGLWDPKTNRWMIPTRGAAPARGGNDSDEPAGAGAATDPALFNLLFRRNETTSNPATDVGGSPRTFQTARQNEVLATGSTGGYALDLDLTRLGDRKAKADPLPLRRGEERDFVRLYRSSIDAEGVIVGGSGGNFALFLSRYQPYALYLPACYEEQNCPWPSGRAPTILTLHGGSGSHLDAGPDLSISEGGTTLIGLRRAYDELEREIAPVFVRTLGRGQRPPWHRGYGELDELEALAAATARYDLDTERRVITGGSLGGYGTLRIASMYPEMWTGAFAHCPAEFENSIGTRAIGNIAPSTQPFTIESVMPNLLNIPLRQASGTADPLVPITADHRIRDAALAAQLDYHYTEYLAGGHCWDNAEAGYPWIGNHLAEYVEMLRRPRQTTPAQVRYMIDPRQFFPGPETIGVLDIRDLGITYDRAYWTSGLALRDDVVAAAAAGDASPDLVGGIEATSRARPWNLAAASCGRSVGLGGATGGNPTLTPRNPTPHTYECQSQSRSGSLANELELTTRHLARATVDVGGAGLNGAEPLTVRARGDGPLSLRLVGVGHGEARGRCVRAASATAGSTTLELDLTEDACAIAIGSASPASSPPSAAPHNGVDGQCPWVEFTRIPAVSTFPDTNTQVFQCVYSAGAAHETFITGRRPSARFWSFALLDQARREIDNISDEQIAFGPDGTYRIAVKVDCAGASNCLETKAGAAPQAPGLIYYRLYVPDAAHGGVGLPSVSYRSNTGTTAAPPFDLAQALSDQEESATAAIVPGGPVYELLANASGAEPAAGVASPEDDPKPARFQGTGSNQVQRLEDAGAPSAVVDLARQGLGRGGFGGTKDNAYLTMDYDMRKGNVVLRAKAPTYRAQHATAANEVGRRDRTEQVRYWSLCTTQATRPVDCVRDERVPLDGSGYFDVVLAPTCPVAGFLVCLRTGALSAAGPGAVGVLLYRNSLARDEFYNDNGPATCPSVASMFCGEFALLAHYRPRS